MRRILRGSSPANILHCAPVYFIFSLIILHGANYTLAQATHETASIVGLPFCHVAF